MTQKSFTSNQRNLELAKNLNKDQLILGVDPGTTTGVVTMTTGGVVRSLANLSIEDVYELLNRQFAKTIQLIVMEDYIVGNRAAHLRGSKNEASQVIGVVNAWSKVYKIPVVMQMPAVKMIAEKLSGKQPHGAHKDMHWMDAFNHGYYFLHSVGLVESRKR
jgi:hypothetical protein